MVEYPWVVVRIECELCPRRGAYRLARLAARYGPEQALDGLLADLASNCPWWRSNPRKDEQRCGARFVDLDRNMPPPDHPDVLAREKLPARENVPQRRSVAPPTPSSPPMLSGWAAIEIRIKCVRCGRRRVYITEELLASGDRRMTDLLTEVTKDCPRRGALSIYEQCAATFDTDEAG